ncbi:hypothetical protein VST7929_01199 [Vibrio stylophorae]|uniref:MotA/TolQ/ExbB proton channel domain-containing protein n=2 Tax=Vibrio stylophorae TaxID=659351 RepID=A0ABN8DS05_9VIBR|nr:hypothetical protein VST7929_01199 [Vibrio stylophorae]
MLTESASHSTNAYHMAQQVLSSGGPLVWVILIVMMLSWLLLLERWLYFKQYGRANFDFLLCQWRRVAFLKPRQIAAIRQNTLNQFAVVHRRRLHWVGLFIALCPMLGMLGTVTGMIHVFDVLGEFGTGNPRLMANGIAMATVPSLCGMIAAVSSLFARSRLLRRIDRQLMKLDEQLVYQQTATMNCE